MTAPLNPAADRERNRREWEAMRANFLASAEYHERAAAEARRMLEHLDKALENFAARGEGGEGITGAWNA